MARADEECPEIYRSDRAAGRIPMRLHGFALVEDARRAGALTDKPQVVANHNA